MTSAQKGALRRALRLSLRGHLLYCSNVVPNFAGRLCLILRTLGPGTPLTIPGGRTMRQRRSPATAFCMPSTRRRNPPDTSRDTRFPRYHRAPDLVHTARDNRLRNLLPPTTCLPCPSTALSFLLLLPNTVQTWRESAFNGQWDAARGINDMTTGGRGIRT